MYPSLLAFKYSYIHAFVHVHVYTARYVFLSPFHSLSTCTFVIRLICGVCLFGLTVHLPIYVCRWKWISSVGTWICIWVCIYACMRPTRLLFPHACTYMHTPHVYKNVHVCKWVHVDKIKQHIYIYIQIKIKLKEIEREWALYRVQKDRL